MPASEFEVVIVGGAIIGSFVAYFLASDRKFNGRIAVIECDPTYRRSATCLSAGSFRQQFSTVTNVRISQFGNAFFREAHELLAVDGCPVDIGLTERTYLYLATSQGEERLRRNVELQSSLGVEVDLLDLGDLLQRYPYISPTGLAVGACTGKGEGWLDSFALLMAVRRKAVSLGVRYLAEQGTEFVLDGASRIKGVRLASSEVITANSVVCAAGTRSQELIAPLGIPLPVRARKRTVFVIDSPAKTPACPLIVDPSGFWLRPEGSGYICGTTPAPDPDVEADDFELDGTCFEDAIWPKLAQRVPGFEAARCRRSWIGHYDYNSFDQNAFLGPLPPFDNLLVACGFSGHGLQQAPAVGRGLAELLMHGAYRSLDLSTLAYERYMRGDPYAEANVI